jgi:hypothetical protein
MGSKDDHEVVSKNNRSFPVRVAVPASARVLMITGKGDFGTHNAEIAGPACASKEPQIGHVAVSEEHPGYRLQLLKIKTAVTEGSKQTDRNIKIKRKHVVGSKTKGNYRRRQEPHSVHPIKVSA